MTEERKGSLPRRMVSIMCSLVTWIVLGIAGLWAFGALWFDLPEFLMPQIAAAAFLLGMILAAALIRPRWRGKLVIAIGIVLVMIWWFTLQPKQFRDWKTEVALTSHAEITGDIVTFYNVRNFNYRTETDFTPHYEIRRLDLKNLKGVDVFINYWGSPYMAHPIASYDFGPDGRICFSIETRPIKGQAYSAIGGLYRQFELIYVVADERDVIRVRTNFRKNEDVYLYRLNSFDAKNSFLEYVHTVNELHTSPRWYNAITNNCTTAIRHQRPNTVRKPLDWRMLINGYGDELLYENGSIDRSMPFDQLKKISLINLKANAANNDPEFSHKIRLGLPGMGQNR